MTTSSTTSTPSDTNNQDEDSSPPSFIPADGEPFLTLLHGTKKIRICHTSSWATLTTYISEATGISSDDQLLLCRGRKLLAPTSPSTSLLSLLPPKSIIMVRRKTRPTSSLSTQPLTPLGIAERDTRNLETDTDELEKAVERHTKGFLDSEKTTQALHSDDEASRRADERAMQLLERVDGLQLSDTRERSRRKSVVTSLNSILVRLDRLRDKISQLMKDEYGEVERRRGKEQH